MDEWIYSTSDVLHLLEVLWHVIQYLHLLLVYYTVYWVSCGLHDFLLCYNWLKLGKTLNPGRTIHILHARNFNCDTVILVTCCWFLELSRTRFSNWGYHSESTMFGPCFWKTWEKSGFREREKTEAKSQREVKTGAHVALEIGREWLELLSAFWFLVLFYHVGQLHFLP